MNTHNKSNGSGDAVLDWAVIIAAGMLFFKTADVLSYFSPEWLNYIFGMDVSFFYGGCTALLIEGMALSLHFNRKARDYTPAKIVKWITLFLSGMCQVFDGFITTGNVDGMSQPLQFALSYGVPLLPLLIMIMVFSIGRLPDEGEYQPTVRDRGLKNMLPNVKELWNGRGVQYPAQTDQVVGQLGQSDYPEQLPPRADGNAGGRNFQKGSRR